MAAREHRSNAARLLEAGQTTAALREIEDAVREEPGDAVAHNLHGLILGSQDLKRHRAAVTAFRKAIACQPAYAEAHCNLGAALLALRQKSALRAFEAALQVDPNYEMARDALTKARSVPWRFSFDGRLSARQRTLVMSLR
jgi:Tfp pilus assembly protein PilF